MKIQLRPGFLENHDLKLVFFGGKGGVGKTSTAVATALWMAKQRPEDSFLLVSTDPAHSLGDCIAGCAVPVNLKTVELNAEECLETFKRKHNLRLREIATRGTFLDDDDTSRLLKLSLPGLDELMAFIEISRWTESDRYQCVIVDTAPTGHTLRLLGMPEFARKWLSALDALLAKHRYMKKRFGRDDRRDETDCFLAEWSLSVKHAQGLLQDARHCRFVPVMLAEPLSVCETVVMVQELEHLKIPTTCMVVNRICPDNDCQACAGRRRRQMRELRQLLSNGRLSGYSLWGVPLYPMEIRGLEALETFWENAHEINILDTRDGLHAPRESVLSLHTPNVDAPAAVPLSETRLLFFAGKGGVGKTTLACATAVRLAGDSEKRNVLLFSIDPAHSLSACLGLEIGAVPTPVCSGLEAMEIDPKTELDALKQLYSDELRKFFRSLSQHIDIAFEREVMEQLMDLSPPGLDEVMSLARIVDFLDRRIYDTIIIDSAPTGHLIRLLELPDIIQSWIKVIFRLFLKYERTFRLPKISQRLVEMSKHLNRLQALLKDPVQSALYAVSILTEMSLQETQDLMAACERMGIGVPVLFLNLATPDSACAFCAALRRRELLVRRQFQQAASGRDLVTVHYCGDPRGLRQLGELGSALYHPACGDAADTLSLAQQDECVATYPSFEEVKHHGAS